VCDFVTLAREVARRAVWPRDILRAAGTDSFNGEPKATLPYDNARNNNRRRRLAEQQPSPSARR
jgi:hypothetical protein